MGKRSALMLAAASAAAAQSILTVDADASTGLNGYKVSGVHVGAAYNYMTVGPEGGDHFRVNGSLTGTHRLVNSDVVAGYELPCGVTNDASISSNSGILVCGGGADTAPAYANAYPGTLVLGIEDVINWWICVATTPSGVSHYESTVVGSFSSSGIPSGPAISGCRSINSLTFGSVAPTSMTTSAHAPYPTNGTVPIVTATITVKACPVCEEEVITTVCPEDELPWKPAKPTPYVPPMPASPPVTNNVVSSPPQPPAAPAVPVSPSGGSSCSGSSCAPAVPVSPVSPPAAPVSPFSPPAAPVSPVSPPAAPVSPNGGSNSPAAPVSPSGGSNSPAVPVSPNGGSSCSGSSCSPASPASPVSPPAAPVSPNGGYSCGGSSCGSVGGSSNTTTPPINPYKGAANDLSSSRFGAIAIAAGCIIGAMLL